MVVGSIFAVFMTTSGAAGHDAIIFDCRHTGQLVCCFQQVRQFRRVAVDVSGLKQQLLFFVEVGAGLACLFQQAGDGMRQIAQDAEREVDVDRDGFAVPHAQILAWGGFEAF
ncbi:hypothetical protein BOO71_0000919 [Deinococcus marmoris]|uniref:Uncharacterized protein n=1 Tax=Deinococcus marmoris TaxID=249408 RepID=A0A1U7P4F2_9DEIO|nr:hypothetical protein BOO71_0000919 [Deinococcus marmoris]